MDVSTRGLRRLWFWVHMVIGVALTAVLIPLSLSGSYLVWRDQIDRATHPARYAVAAAPPSPSWGDDDDYGGGGGGDGISDGSGLSDEDEDDDDMGDGDGAGRATHHPEPTDFEGGGFRRGTRPAPGFVRPSPPDDHVLTVMEFTGVGRARALELLAVHGSAAAAVAALFP